jgi:hypothetical protein
MSREGEAARALMREIYLQDLALSVYRIYLPRLRDANACAILTNYLEGEKFRAAQIEHYLRRQGLEPAAVIRGLFRGIGRIYGRVTALLGTRLILRIILSVSVKATRGACASLAAEESPEIVFLNTLRARNEGDLLDALRQHMIDTLSRSG